MTDLDNFLPYVLPSAVGCSDILARQHLRTAARDFLKTTRMWREISTVSVAANATHTGISTSADAVLIDFDKIWFKAQSSDVGIELTPEQYSSRAPSEYPALWVVAQLEPNTLTLKAPQSGNFEISMFLMPSPAAETLPDFLFDNFVETIADGALGTLLAIPGRPYTNPETAVWHAARFEQKKNQHFASNLRGQQRAPLRTKARFL